MYVAYSKPDKYLVKRSDLRFVTGIIYHFLSDSSKSLALNYPTIA